MNSLYALVVAVRLLSGSVEEDVLGVYESEAQCHQAAVEQGVKNGECWPVEGIQHNGEIPATLAREGFEE